eukprot:1157427-Pelagomonas_calceolata.AAC.3
MVLLLATSGSIVASIPHRMHFMPRAISAVKAAKLAEQNMWTTKEHTWIRSPVECAQKYGHPTFYRADLVYYRADVIFYKADLILQRIALIQHRTHLILQHQLPNVCAHKCAHRDIHCTAHAPALVLVSVYFQGQRDPPCDLQPQVCTFSVIPAIGGPQCGTPEDLQLQGHKSPVAA